MERQQRVRAGIAVGARMAELGLRAADVQRAAAIDHKTLKSLLDGSRAASHATRGRVERVLGWPAGEIDRRGRGEVSQAGPPPISDEQLIAELALRLGRATAVARHRLNLDAQPLGTADEILGERADEILLSILTDPDLLRLPPSEVTIYAGPAHDGASALQAHAWHAEQATTLEDHILADLPPEAAAAARELQQRGRGAARRSTSAERTEPA